MEFAKVSHKTNIEHPGTTIVPVPISAGSVDLMKNKTQAMETLGLLGAEAPWEERDGGGGGGDDDDDDGDDERDEDDEQTGCFRVSEYPTAEAPVVG